jgi:hypothetical protein
MDTLKQGFLKRYIAHIKECPICLMVGSNFDALCPVGSAILNCYRQEVGGPVEEYLEELSTMHWDEIVMALMGVNEDSDEVWVVCLDQVIAQKCEIIWALSEAFWKDHDYEKRL